MKKPWLLPLLLILTNIIQTNLLQAAPVAYPDVLLEGKKYKFVIVETHPDGKISYTLNGKKETKPADQVPPQIAALIKPQPTPAPTSAPTPLTQTEIDAIKKKWESWGKNTIKNSETTSTKVEEGQIENRIEKKENQENASYKILVQITESIPGGCLTQRLKIPESTSLDLLPYNLSP